MIPFLIGKPTDGSVYTVRWNRESGRVYMRLNYNGSSILQDNEMLCSKEVYDNYTRYKYFRGLLIEQPE
jgi:hypothetical protein